jgi:acyl-[acyl-carrier-protein]-phospholipid O-acyltransferase/long-chain-fatty-acid--[acyl-carrier-protein] ligase
MRYLFAAAEKVQQTTYDTWAQKFGVRILEGYGATECSPCVSVCTPLTPKHGTAGRMIPGMEWKVEPVEGVGGTDPGSQIPDTGSKTPESTGAHPASGIRDQASTSSTGRLLVRGPNVMKGYLNPDANAKFQALGGWYDTGDIVRIDEDKFVHILGRLKRFAKVSGEMVSLTAVEDALAGAFKDEFGSRCETAVVAVPDEDKGERLIAIANEPKLTLDHLRTAIKAKGLTNLCVPKEIKFVKEIPKLGTGKVNHRELLALVKEN